MKKIYSLLLLGGLLLFGTQSVLAGDGDVGMHSHIYFDNSESNWSYSHVYFVINDTYGNEMTAITNTKLYYYYRTLGTYDNYECVRLFAASTDWGGDTNEDVSMGGWTNMYNNCANITDGENSFTFESDKCISVKPNKTGSKTDLATLTCSEVGSSSTSFNSTQTIKFKLSDADGIYSEVTAGAAPGTITISSYKFDADEVDPYTTVYSNNGTASGTTLYATATAARTATTTLTAEAATGYLFMGWYDNSGNELSTSTTYVYYPNSATTVFAYFSPAITLSVKVPYENCSGLRAHVWKTVGNTNTPLWTWDSEPYIQEGSIDEDTYYTLTLPDFYDGVIWKWYESGTNAGNKKSEDMVFGNYNYEIGVYWEMDGTVGKFYATAKKSITPTPDGYATFYAAHHAQLPEGVVAYNGVYNPAASTLTLNAVTNSGYVYAGRPVVLKSSNGTAYDVTINAGAELSTETGSNNLHGTTSVIPTPANAYVLGYANSATKFFSFAGSTIPANKAYLQISDGAAYAAGIRVIFEENTTTDINSIEASEEAVKFFQDGKLFIKKNGVVYDIMGTIVK